MTTTPDGISFSDLQELIKDAPKEADAPLKDLTAKEMEEIADKCLSLAAELGARGPMVHKIMMVMTLNNLIDWHTGIGEKHLDAGETEAGMAWLKDAGKCQSILNILYSIQCGENDFLLNE